MSIPLSKIHKYNLQSVKFINDTRIMFELMKDCPRIIDPQQHQCKYESPFSIFLNKNGEPQGCSGDLIFHFDKTNDQQQAHADAQHLLMDLLKANAFSTNKVTIHHCDTSYRIVVAEELLHVPAATCLHLPHVYYFTLKKIAGKLNTLKTDVYGHGLRSLAPAWSAQSYTQVDISTFMNQSITANNPATSFNTKIALTGDILRGSYLASIKHVYQKMLKSIYLFHSEELGTECSQIKSLYNRFACINKMLDPVCSRITTHPDYPALMHSLLAEKHTMLFRIWEDLFYGNYYEDDAYLPQVKPTKRMALTTCKDLHYATECYQKNLCGVKSPFELYGAKIPNKKQTSSPLYGTKRNKELINFIAAELNWKRPFSAEEHIPPFLMLLGEIAMASHGKLVIAEEGRRIPLTVYFGIVPQNNTSMSPPFSQNYTSWLKLWESNIKQIEKQAQTQATAYHNNLSQRIKVLIAKRQALYRRIKKATTAYEDISHLIQEKVNISNEISDVKRKLHRPSKLLQKYRPSPKETGHFCFSHPEEVSQIEHFFKGTSRAKEGYIKQIGQSFDSITPSLSGCFLHIDQITAQKLRSSQVTSSAGNLFLFFPYAYKEQLQGPPQISYLSHNVLETILSGPQQAISVDHAVMQELETELKSEKMAQLNVPYPVLKLQAIKLIVLIHLLQHKQIITPVSNPEYVQAACSLLLYSYSFIPAQSTIKKQNCAGKIKEWLTKRRSPFVYHRNIQRQFSSHSRQELYAAISTLIEQEVLCEVITQPKRQRGAPTSPLYKVNLGQIIKEVP